MKKLDKFKPLKVAEQKGKYWEWDPSLPSTYKIYYNKKVQIDRFFQKQSFLYVWTVNQTYLKALVRGGEKVAGSIYVLGLSLAGGKRDAQFRNTYKKLKSVLAGRAYDYYAQRELMFKIEKYLKSHALAVGVWDDGSVQWRPPHYGELSLKTIREYASRDKRGEHFIVIDDVVYYLRRYAVGVEQLFYKCVQLAGSEHALALAISSDRKEFDKHKKAFERLSFRQRRTLGYYARLFESYLNKNPQLFDAEVSV